ncbi:MBL fold metallo-hydrolase [Amycolatopsis sp. NPDC051903]|uniref:MBL fold metallo-hydrolase n=1 Tax=Amycolatopsis sp. NPDC051903 TaxID=3363936 RepID=UPI00379856E9
MAGALNEQSAVRVLEIAGVRFTYVVDGAMAMVRKAFFGGVPAAYWTEHPEALDAQGRVAMSAGGLLVEREGRVLLVDAGLGDVRGPVLVAGETVGYCNSGALPETLAALGHRPEDVEAVAFTHIHVDHTGWAFSGGRKFFPSAAYLVARAEWAPHERGELIPGAPARADVIEPLAASHRLIADGEEVFPGVRALVTPGHSPGHTSYLVEAGAQRVLAVGDVFHLPAQITHPDWPSRPDVDAAGVLAARRRVVAELEQPGTIGFAFHFGDQAFGRVVRGADGLRYWQPVEAEAVLPAPRLLAD